MIFTCGSLLLTVTVLSVAGTSISSLTAEQEYTAYLRAFGKSLDRLSDPHRVERFLNQLQFIHEHNERKAGGGMKASAFNLQLNAMSDMLPEEVNQLFGYRNIKKNIEHKQKNSLKHEKSLRKKKHVDDEDEKYYHSNLYPFFGRKNKGKSKEALLKNVVLPESINWSNENNPIGSSVMSSVRNQGTCGACWAFVAVATAEAALRISLSGSASTTEKTLKMPGATEQTHIVQTQGYTMLQSSIANNTLSHSNDNTDTVGGVHDGRNAHTNNQYTTAFKSQTRTKPSNNPTTSNNTNLHSNNPLYNSLFPLELSNPSRLAWIPSLSVQQLVDCDTSFNRGCNGGSPLYAFRFIASKGLVPWSRYEYEEKVDTCHVKKATILPVAKYYIRDYGKVTMLDSTALMVAVSKGPVALGVCGTDPHFMLYSNGVFDLDTCCTDQNHAITLVGYGHDEATGLDYWLAQNSWGKLWGESGYIKLKRTEVVGQPGICGMLANPMYGTGGYILDEKGHFIDPSTSPHYPGYITDIEHWMQDNWREMMVLVSGWLLCISLMILLYACYIERLMYLHAQLRAANEGYSTIEDEDDNLIL